MVQSANYAGLLMNLPTVEEVLDDHTSELGHDLVAYRNHVYRVVNLCLAIHRRLVQLTIDEFWKHPLTPLPMLKWRRR